MDGKRIQEMVGKSDDNALMKLQRNAERLLDDPRMGASAQQMLECIAAESSRRVSAVAQDARKAATPDQGMLRHYGYKVGKSGLTEIGRQNRLKSLLCDHLPLVGSPAYVAEWGAPRSMRRYRKLHRVIQVLISSNRHFDNREDAIGDWEADLRYLEMAWRPKLLDPEP